MKNIWDIDRNWWFLLIPAFFLIFFITLYPLIQGVYIAFLHYKLAEPPVTFIGLEGFAILFNNQFFQYAFFISLVFSALVVTLTTFTGLFFSLLLNEQIKGRGICRALILIPWAVPHIVNGIIWGWMFHGRYGVIPYLLVALGITETQVAFLSTPTLAILAIAIAHVWTYTPISILILLSSLQAIPIDLYEAARVDGASTWQQFRFITLPLLRNGILLVITFITMWSLRTFDEIYAMTSGGPAGATNLVGWFIYNSILIDYDYGRGSAASVILAIVIMIVALFYYRILYRRVRY